MSSFSRFKDFNQKRGMINQETNSKFIVKGYPSILITNAATNDEIQASVVNRQEKDMAYIYTHKENPIEVGSVWGAKGLNWLISEEIIIIKDVSWHKYTAFLCNVQVNGLWGYFISPEKSSINVALREEVLLQSQQKPILVLGKDILDIGDKFTIKNRAWMVREKDDFDMNGITYYSLVATTISKDSTYQKEEDTELKPQIPDVVPFAARDEYKLFIPDSEITLPTFEGYFTSESKAVKITKLSLKEVRFIIPFGIDEVKVYVRSNPNDPEQIAQYIYRKAV